MSDSKALKIYIWEQEGKVSENASRGKSVDGKEEATEGRGGLKRRKGDEPCRALSGLSSKTGTATARGPGTDPVPSVLLLPVPSDLFPRDLLVIPSVDHQKPIPCRNAEV